METNFTKSLSFVLQSEGGFVNDPDDPGGATNKGITLAAYRTLHPKATVADLKAISDEDVKAIYHRDYWLAAGCGNIPSGLDYCVFDCAVNMGVRRGCEMKNTFWLRASSSVPTAISAMCDWRKRYYRKLAASKKSLDKFLRGWISRVDFVQKNALEMAHNKGKAMS